MAASALTIEAADEIEFPAELIESFDTPAEVVEWGDVVKQHAT